MAFFMICILGFFLSTPRPFPPHSTCWIPDSDSGDLKKSKKGWCGFLKVCQKPWGLGMIRISIEVEMSLNA